MRALTEQAQDIAQHATTGVASDPSSKGSAG
jgi:hypothetical protein